MFLFWKYLHLEMQAGKPRLRHLQAIHPGHACRTDCVMAQDIKVMLQSLRKVRRSWRHIARQTNVDWPKRSQRYPKTLQVLQVMEDVEVPSNDLDELGEIWKQGEEEELHGMWPDLAGQCDTLEAKLERKRKAALSDLQRKQVMICESDEA